MGGIERFRENDVAFLQVPAQDDLSRALAVLLRQLGENRLGHQFGIAVAKRIPGLERHVAVLEERLHLMLVPIRVHLDLQHRGGDRSHVEHLLRLGLAEVRQADRTHLARSHGILHRLPRFRVPAVGLVQEQQIQIVGVQAAQCGVDGLAAVLVPVILREQLGGDEEFAAVDAAALDDAADGLLVEVGVGRVDMTVAGFDGLRQMRLDLGRAHQKDAVTDGGNGMPVIHGVVDHCSSFRIMRTAADSADPMSADVRPGAIRTFPVSGNRAGGYNATCPATYA